MARMDASTLVAIPLVLVGVVVVLMLVVLLVLRESARPHLLGRPRPKGSHPADTVEARLSRGENTRDDSEARRHPLVARDPLSPPPAAMDQH